MKYDYCIIGGGIVGSSTALQILEREPFAKVLLLDKEKSLCSHQSSHNSGVVHAGIYYAPGSIKSKLCKEGLSETREFCKRYNLPYSECGKLIVATNDIELERLEKLYIRAESNGIDIRRIDKKTLTKLEPQVEGLEAILSPRTSIVDYALICKTMSKLLKEKGGEVISNFEVKDIVETDMAVDITNGVSKFLASKLIVCAGLQADRLARMGGLDINFRIVPFRGEYFQLPKKKNNVINKLIYPVPDPSLPFLGVHLTRMIDGSVTVGPNAVLGFDRESYDKKRFSFTDTLDFMMFSGFWKLIYKFKENALSELYASNFKYAYLKQVKKYCPSLTIQDLKPYRPGIRAQVVDASGDPIHDFLFMNTDRQLHVCNAPSPAATSAIPIGKMLAAKAVSM